MQTINHLKIRLSKLLSNSPIWCYSTFANFARIFDEIQLRYYLLTNRQLVIIYQQGRVASTAVYEALLKASTHYAIYHVHFLTLENITKQKSLPHRRRIHRHLYIGSMLQKHLLNKKINQSHKQKLKFITILRDPISTYLSALFMTPERYLTNYDKNNNSEDYRNNITYQIKEKIENGNMPTWSSSHWLEDELHKALNLNLYSIEVDRKKAYFILEYDRYEILVLKFEHLKETFESATADFLGILPENCQLKKSNPHGKKQVQSLQTYISRNLKLSNETLTKVYQIEYMKHFYSDEEINSFIQKWSHLNSC